MNADPFDDGAAGAAAVDGPSSTGLEPRVAAALSYLIGWVTGILFFVLEERSRYVRFHAMQSIIALGGLWALGVAFWVLSFLSVFVSATGFHVLMWTAQGTWLVGVIVWLVCLFKAYAGDWWKLPIAGTVAERIAAR